MNPIDSKSKKRVLNFVQREKKNVKYYFIDYIHMIINIIKLKDYL